MDTSEVIKKLRSRVPIFVTKNLLPFDPFGKPGLFDSELIQVSNYSILERSDGFSVIYYEWGEPYIDYSTYLTSDYNITWGFSSDEMIQYRAEFKDHLNSLPNDTLFSYLWDEATNFDYRFRFDVCQILSSRINNGDTTK